MNLIKKSLLMLLLTITCSLGSNNCLFSQEKPSAETATEEVSDAEMEKLLSEAETDVAITDTATAVIVDSAINVPESFGIFGVPLADCSEATEDLNLWTAFFFGILGGLAALFFPCTFPMIPMTMSFFLKGSEQGKGTRNAILYGFCIFLVYFLLSLPFHFGLGGAALNNFSTNVWVNLIFFVIFIFFSFSLFGFYDISLPASLGNKLDSKSGTGTFIGIFFMAFTLAIVSFSCTGPILGLVLASAKNSAFITPAFSGFGIGLGVPFAIFALFPKLLKNLPKSGSWLDVVKVIFGFIELAFAFKFLSNADLVERWGILKREPFVLIWIAVFTLQGLYLIGLFKFKKESIIKKTPITWLLAIASFLFVGYLATDFFGGELRYLSGFPPPKSYSINHQKEHFETNQNQYATALAKAKAEKKLLLIDFTGWACVNCRRMEENVWIAPEVYDLLAKNYVITSLYVDQKTALPKDQQYYSKTLEKDVVTEGDKWSEMQAKNLYQFTQPQYAIIDPNTERIINKPIGGYNEVSIFKKFLECGIQFKDKK